MPQFTKERKKRNSRQKVHQETEMNQHVLERLRKPHKGEWTVGKGQTISTGCIERSGTNEAESRKPGKAEELVICHVEVLIMSTLCIWRKSQHRW